MSAIGTPIIAGPESPSGDRVTSRMPAAATVAVSWAGLSRHGPVCPKAEIEQYTRPGFSAESVSKSMPSRLATPGRNASTTTSACLAKASRARLPASVLRSSAMLSLPRWVLRNMTVSPPCCQGKASAERVGSGARGFSTLMTRAP